MEYCDYKLYELIYDITQSNMIKASDSLKYGKKAFVTLVNVEPNCVNLLDLITLDNEDFFVSAYVSLLHRIPDDNAFVNWSKLLELPKEEFQSKVIITIIKSQEFMNNNIQIKNNFVEFVPINELKNKSKILYLRSKSIKSRLLGNQILYKFYRKMPKTFKVIIKKILRYEVV